MTTAATSSKPPLLPPQPPSLSVPSPTQPPPMQLVQTQQRQQLPPPPQEEQLPPPQQARLAQPAPSASRPEPVRRQQMPPLAPSTPRQSRSPLHHGHLLAPVQPIAPSPNAAVSPPSKRDLKSWWKSFKPQSKSQEAPDQRPRGIFGVPLRESIIYANVAISLDENGKSYIYGYVPIVVAKCGVFLKEKATNIEGIFRLSGSEKRIKELKSAFDSPDRYGKGLSWNGYTVHDAANVLRRYLNDLPEPVVPLSFYARFREPLRGAIRQPVADADGPQFVEGFDMGAAIVRYQRLITELPPLHRQLLLYILDLLAVFAAKSDVNRMNSQNLAAIFQPGILSHPYHAMAPEEYRLNQTVLIFLIENQDHFLIGMQGTAADAETVQEVQRGTPPVTPSFAFDNANGGGLTHRISNASAGAESVARDGKIRRNHSTSSRKSRHSNSNSASNNAHVSTPRSSSPALIATPTSASGGGLSRSNTVPSRSPGLTPGRFNKRSDVAASPVSPLTPLAHHSPSHTAPSVEPVKEVVTPSDDTNTQDPFTTVYPAADATIPAATTTPTQPRTPTFASLPPLTAAAPSTPIARDSGASTPSKEKRFQIFQRSPTSDSEMRPQPNKLRKRRIPSSANASAQSSTASLPPSSSILASPSRDYVANPFDERAASSLAALGVLSAPASSSSLRQTSNADAVSENGFDFTPRVSQVPSTATMTATTAALSPTPAPAATATATTASTATTAATAAATGSSTSEGQLRPHRKSPSTSLHSSFNEGSDLDQVDEVPSGIVQEQAEQTDKTKKRLWRLSRRRDESLSISAPGLSTSNLSSTSTPPQHASSLGSNMNAEASTSSIGSGGPVPVPMGALFNAGANGYSDPTLTTAEAQMSQDSGTTTSSSRDGREENGKGKLSGWLKSKYREAKGSTDRRNKSPPPTDQANQFVPLAATRRGKSLDLSRATGEGKSPV